MFHSLKIRTRLFLLVGGLLIVGIILGIVGISGVNTLMEVESYENKVGSI